MWYYEIDHQPQGPVDIDTIKRLLDAGTINAATLVWRAGMPDWRPLRQTALAGNIATPVVSDSRSVYLQLPLHLAVYNISPSISKIGGDQKSYVTESEN